MLQQGTLTEWNDERGFGFIAPAGGGSRVFVHISAFAQRRRRPAVNDRVRYEVMRDERRRLCAAKVRYLDRANRRRGISGFFFALAVCAIFFALLVDFVYGGVAQPIVLEAYVAVSVLTLLTYGYDKYRAQRGGRRTPESTLHLLALAGGWPGALLAQRLFRHKTKKRPFQWVFLGTVVFNLAGLGTFLFRDEVQDFLLSIGLWIR